MLAVFAFVSLRSAVRHRPTARTSICAPIMMSFHHHSPSLLLSDGHLRYVLQLVCCFDDGNNILIITRRRLLSQGDTTSRLAWPLHPSAAQTSPENIDRKIGGSWRRTDRFLAGIIACRYNLSGFRQIFLGTQIKHHPSACHSSAEAVQEE